MFIWLMMTKQRILIIGPHNQKTLRTLFFDSMNGEFSSTSSSSAPPCTKRRKGKNTLNKTVEPEDDLIWWKMISLVQKTLLKAQCAFCLLWDCKALPHHVWFNQMIYHIIYKQLLHWFSDHSLSILNILNGLAIWLKICICPFCGHGWTEAATVVVCQAVQPQCRSLKQKGDIWTADYRALLR